METAARRKTNSPSYSTAYYFLEGLNELGIEYLFCNFGTDHAPIIEEMAHRRKRGEHVPNIIALPAREHRRPHGGGLRVRDRTRPGRAGARRRRHREHRDRDAQPVPQPAAGAADGRQGAVHHRQRAGRLARHLRALRAGAVRSGQPGAALHEVGMDAAIRHRGEGGAAPRPLHHAERAAGPGLSDDAARDADAALERATRSAASAPTSHGSTAGGGADPKLVVAARRQAARGRESDPDHRLCRPQSARVRS